MPRRRALVALPLVLLVASLAACTESTRIPPAEPPSATQPLFASDEEALAAATAAYEEFLSVSGRILRDGGSKPERLKPFVSKDVYTSEAEGFATLASNGWRATGDSVLVETQLQQHQSGPPGVAEVIAYVCVSVEGNDIVDRAGTSQVAADRSVELTFEIVYMSNDEGDLLLERKTLWSEGSSCSLN